MPEAVERMGVEMFMGISEFIKNTRTYERIMVGASKKTDAYGAAVEKSTKGADQSWEQYTTNLTKMLDEQERQVDEAKRSNDEFADNSKRNTEQAGNSWKQFSQSTIGQVAKMKASIDAARFAITAFVGPFKQFMAIGKEAVALQRTQKMFRDIVGGVEEYEDALVSMREITKGTLKDTQLISSSLSIMRRGYADTADNAALLARNIALAGQAMGQVPTAESAMQVFSLMLSNQSMMRMDAFVTNVDAVRKRFKELKDEGMGVEEAFATAAIEGINNEVEQLGLNVETSTTKLNRMEAQFGNLGDNLKTLVVPLFNDFVDIVTGGAENININIDNIKHNIAVFAGTVRGHVAQVGESLQVLIFGFLSMTEAIKGNADEAVRFFELSQNSFQRVIERLPMLEAIEHQVTTMYADAGVAAVSSADTQVNALGQVEAAWDELAAATAAYEDEVAGVTAGLEAQAAQDAIAELRKVQDAAIVAARQREETARQMAAKIMAIEQQLAGVVAQAHISYQATLQRIDQQGAEQRLKIEEDFQKRRRDILRRFEMSETQAIRNRDAGALSDARTQRDEELAQAEEQRNEQLQQARQAQEAQTQAAQEALNQQLEAARQAYNDQLAALQASLLEQEEARKRKQQEDEEDAQRARERERGARLQEAGAKIAGIFLANQEELVAMRQHYNSLTAELQAYYNNVSAYYTAIAQVTGVATNMGVGGPPVVGSRQTGGYMATPGLYRGGETGTEFAMDATTTKAMGGALGGLTQTSLRQLASAIQSPGTVNHSVSGDISGNIDVVLKQGIAGMEGRLMAAMNRQMREIFKVR